MKEIKKKKKQGEEGERENYWKPLVTPAFPTYTGHRSASILPPHGPLQLLSFSLATDSEDALRKCLHTLCGLVGI